ncbi:MAG: DUF3467 domain-containing protein [Proteobacteria bacterium]|jgi:hypothetical protein|nr:DUF3467 domain-containing protein [Pseudomonadota bacterium]HUT83060.1 DUF3467 domain-containing protein [Thermodesulfobacteriota bacterium]
MAGEMKSQEIKVKISDDVLKGVYSNNAVISHTREEFLIDFMNIFPPEGIVNARVIMSPGHVKRLIKALADNVNKYEAKFGTIPDVPEPESRKVGFVQ